MPNAPLHIVVLAAGKGTRMQSAVPKVLHPVAGRSMLGHVLATASALGPAALSVVIAPDMDAARVEIGRIAPGAGVYAQSEPLGTAHALRAAEPALAAHRGDVLVIFGDTPLIEAATLQRLLAALDGAGLAVLGFEARDPTGYGRLVTDAAGDVTAIVEERDASPRQAAITLCNSGVMAFRMPELPKLLQRIGNDNAKREYYLTDAVALARSDGVRTVCVTCPEEEVLGINSRRQLAEAERIYQDRARRAAMDAGATLVAPETVWFSFDTVLGRDVRIEPNVVFGPGCAVEDGVEILANCHFVGARIRSGARVGPFARFRPGADIGPNVHIGNFVEVKNAALEDGAKANHLSYIGDGRVGAGANIGAGTIFCNYDGFNKSVTDVGPGAFIGSNSALVAPVKVGAGAYVGAGSVISKDVAADALVVVRGSLEERPGWAAKFRQMMLKRRQRPGGQGPEKP